MAAEQKNKLDPAKILEGVLTMKGAVAPYYSYFGDGHSVTNMAYAWQQGAHEIVGLKRHWANVGREPLPDAWRHRYRIWVPWFRQVLKHDPDAGQDVQEKILGGFNDVPCIIPFRKLLASRYSRSRRLDGMSCI